MKEFLESTLGKVVLLVLVIIIWGINAFQFSSLSESETLRPYSTPGADSAAVTQLISSNYRYQPGAIDPFRPLEGAELTSPTTTSLAGNETIYDQSEITLSGVIGETAILVLSSGERFLASEGDTISAFVVLEISTDSVRVVRGVQEFILKTN